MSADTPSPDRSFDPWARPEAPEISDAPRPARTSVWFLVEQSSGQTHPRHIPIHSSPFTIGRKSDLSLSLKSPTVSSLHAELIETNQVLFIQDLNSTNGTYVNGQRIDRLTVLKPDDLVQFADIAFRLRPQDANSSSRTLQEDVCDQALALVQFDHLMNERAVVPFLQPIVMMRDGSLIGYEVLGRSRIYSLEQPAAMFRAARQLNLEVELSQMFREEGVRNSLTMTNKPHLFLNTHPREMEQPGLLESMRALRESSDQPLTLEIHEASVTDPKAMGELQAGLRELNISLAYDDFGAGQTRLVELVEVRPDYLKFDMQLIRDIDLAGPQRQQMLETLVQMAHELGIVSLAEGIETEGEAVACRQMKFEMAQGFYYGKPAPIRSYSSSAERPGSSAPPA